MTGHSDHEGTVVVDLRALQTPDSRGRGICRYAYEFATALERHRPDLVCRYLLAPDWPPPGDISELLESGKVTYARTTGWIPESARVYHSLSVFELAAPLRLVWPPEVEHLGLSFSAAVYDLIPLRHDDVYLADPRQRRRYRARSEVLRQADALLAISSKTKTEVVDLLGLDDSSITVVGSGRPLNMSPASDSAAALAEAMALVPGLEPRFVLYPGGSDARKNVDGLIAAYSLLPEGIRSTYQLVVCCDLPALSANHFRHLAAAAGIGDRLLLPGYVPDAALRAMYQTTAAMCFPSLAEGFCLPVAEAMTCGAVVVAADISPLDEFVPPDARFDPTDPSSISRVLLRALTDESFRSGNRSHSNAGDWMQPWQDVIDRSAKVFEALAAKRRTAWRSSPRVAIISPFPPIASGVAAYSSLLVRAVCDELAAVSPRTEVDCFADGLDRNPSAPEFPTTGDSYDAKTFLSTRNAVGGYDRVIYVLGNSEYHGFALAALREQAGVVIAHDVRMTNLLRYSSHIPGAVEGGLEGAIRRSYGGLLPEGLGRNEEVSEADTERFGLMLMRDVAKDAEMVFVSSEAARRLAVTDVGPELEQRIAVLPFAMAMPQSELDVVSASRARRLEDERSGAPQPPLIASFGIVNPTKCPHLLIQAVATVVAGGGAGSDAELIFVGPISDELALGLGALAADLGIGHRTRFTGFVPRNEFLRYLGRTTVAVQLRSSFGGESSGAVGDCLAGGVPTIVSQIGSLTELPGDCVRKLDPRAGHAEIADEIAALISRPERRARMSEKASRHAAGHSIEHTAKVLVEALGLDRLQAGGGEAGGRDSE